ncbi:MAG: twin-arginine translocase subunit TatB [Mesorhizobium sp.]|uniref:Sec-independent protein translocase protein TatB n=1 Tax=unclassified Mesorhizobium TaxID=325217 RepID=UPI000FEA3F72|nr:MULTISPECIES: Sec-independent protein translocase protein TatB [unclassified Mesorhizobium]MDG4906376.1 Sec-independent protein translocase protein TatB [Mesorhizobium sp. WSM4898]RWG58708.1 MAG: twin-arginine translocase subunit TatB [Mesorhizobium sp.]RWH30977.1 MAG: twin-arginine translocase subunit TatB [Mesorhizobium sp.]RWH38956.1 MAG: twin-arginine translocase subunit TatB [Mesorhizobium sp.]RWI21381.1 MAG: twin-arginine translocase subunit TatB [Mesorhizobium sp.]
MFEVGWSELLVIAVVMIVVVGPKDLPNMLRTFGRTAAKLRAMAGDFQKQFNDALKEAELDDVKDSVDSLRGLSPMNEIRKQLNPFEQAAADVRAGVDTMMKPKPASDQAPSDATTPQPAEPLKNGATEISGINGTDVAPAVPMSPPAAPISPALTEASVTTPIAETAGSAQPAKKVAASKAKAAGAAAKAASAKAPATKAPAKSAPAAAKVAAPAKEAASKVEANPAAKKPAVKKAADAKKTAGAAK